MDHAAKDGAPKILKECALPAHRARRRPPHHHRPRGASTSPAEGLVLRELAPGVSAREVQERTEPTLRVPLRRDRDDVRLVKGRRTWSGPRRTCPPSTRARSGRSASACSAAATAAARRSPRASSPPNFEVCPLCGQHHKLDADGWRRLLLDDGTLEVWDEHLEPGDPLRFIDGRSYKDRIAAAQKKSKARESVEIGRAVASASGPSPTARSSSRSWAGAWARSPGEKVTRLFERAVDRRAAGGAPPGLGRRAHAGGHPLADADGQERRRARALPRDAAALRVGAPPPDHGRRRGELRVPRRRQHRRAQGADRLRRAARHREHHPADPAAAASSAPSSCSSTG